MNINETPPPESNCYKCGQPIDWQDEVWIDPKGFDRMGSAEPFHVSCAPEEKGYDNPQ